MGCFHYGSLALAFVKAAHFLVFYKDRAPDPHGDISNERPMGTFLLVDYISLVIGHPASRFLKQTLFVRRNPARAGCLYQCF